MADQADSMEEGPTTGAATPAAKRSPGHRAMDAREAAAEMAARAHEISLEAGSKMSGAMRDVINAAAGLAGFAVESARDLVQFMVRRGQMTQDEADRLIREAEAASAAHRPAVAARPAPQTSAPVRAPNAAVAPPAAAPSAPASAPATKTAKKAAAESAPAAKSAKAEAAEKPAKSGKAAPAAKEPAKAPAKAAAKAPAKSTTKAAAKAPAKSAAKAPAKTPAKTAAKSAKASKPAAKGSGASAKSAPSKSAAATKKR